jgi:quaternary ammonium compound-resistance protein SugE
MAWLILFVAGLLEVGWAIGLKYTDGFTKLWPSIWTGLTLALSMWLLATAARTLPIGTAYAVWTGIGAAGTAVLGMALFGESASPTRLLCLGLIIAGVLGLKLAGDGGH